MKSSVSSCPTGQVVDGPQYGVSPQPWDIPVQLPPRFTDKVEMVRVPHSSIVKVQLLVSYLRQSRFWCVVFVAYLCVLYKVVTCVCVCVRVCVCSGVSHVQRLWEGSLYRLSRQRPGEMFRNILCFSLHSVKLKLSSLWRNVALMFHLPAIWTGSVPSHLGDPVVDRQAALWCEHHRVVSVCQSEIF